MKNLIRKIGVALLFLAILQVGIAQVVDFSHSKACKGNETHFVNATTGSSAVTSYRWLLGSDPTPMGISENFSYTFINADVYRVTLEAYIGAILVDSESKNVVVDEAPTANFEISNNCFGYPVNFTTIQNDEIEIYQWNYGDGSGEFNNIANPMHYYAIEGSYTVSLIVAAYNTCSDTITKEINVFPTPVAEIQGTLNEVCEGDVIELYVDDYSYVAWGASIFTTNEQVQNDTLTFDVPSGISQIDAEVVVFSIYENQTICKDTAYVTIRVNSIPEINIASTDTIVLPGGQVTLTAASNHNIDEYYWTPVTNMDNPFSASPFVVINKPTIFAVIITDENGCKNDGSIFVDVKLKADNLITPNGDGHNDTWFVSHNGLSDDYEVVIFNRWGEEVNSYQGYQNNWDGKCDNGELPEGAYFYVIKYKDITYTGSITLLR